MVLSDIDDDILITGRCSFKCTAYTTKLKLVYDMSKLI